ncbi:OmpA family protein [Cesiribacter andamanensis]|uniref:Outer membrane protein ArfA n=1 Tax=Cesiribacter andamanensis AMV16 TaxID=1279009 RepID=M7MX37_9BACT|nr:OmpA family protein [Cesiribacter andamanensis]EMR00993.1 Outer membrane protein ArfA [Cesiribacter andamanensis AMV16]
MKKRESLRYLLLSLLLVGIMSGTLPAQVRYAQNATDSLVFISGRVLSAKDSTPVTARIRFRKLPHGDDVGVSSSNKVGAYQMPVLNERSYMFEAIAEGYVPLRQQIDIFDFDHDQLVRKDFMMEPVRIGQIMEFDNILFEQSEAILMQQSYPLLDRLVDMMIHNPRLIIQLEGHTDFRGPAQANKRLSGERVTVIRNYLINKGIQKDRVKTRAFGGSNPLSTDDTPEARQLNRRVEIRILQE